MRGARLSVLACLAGELAIAGCATKPPHRLDHNALRASQPRTLVVAEDLGPAMTAEGPTTEGYNPAFAFGLVGGMAAAAHDKGTNRKRAGWMKRCGIEDPVEEIRETAAETLAEMLSLEVQESDRTTKSTSPDDVIKDYPGADLILDIRTSKWGIDRVEAASSRGEVHFAAIYEGSFRLIDARKSAVVVEAACAIQFSNGGDPPTLNQLFADDCALLKKGLTLSAQTCAKRYRTRVLGLE